MKKGINEGIKRVVETEKIMYIHLLNIVIHGELNIFTENNDVTAL